MALCKGSCELEQHAYTAVLAHVQQLTAWSGAQVALLYGYVLIQWIQWSFSGLTLLGPGTVHLSIVVLVVL